MRIIIYPPQPTWVLWPKVLHFTPLKECALIIIMWVLLHGVFKHCGFKVQSEYYIFEHFQ